MLILTLTTIILLLPSNFVLISGQIPSEILCGDESDNDNDGNIDLNDSDCFSKIRSLQTPVPSIISPSSNSSTDPDSNTSLLIENSSQQIKQYENLKEKIRINFPSSWEQIDINDNGSGNGLRLMAAFVLPNEKNIPIGVSIGVHNLSSMLSIEQYSEIQINFLRSVVNISSYSKSNLSSLNDYDVFYSNDQGLMTLQTWVLKNNKAYHFTYAAPEEQFYSIMPSIKEMRTTFVIG